MNERFPSQLRTLGLGYNKITDLLAPLFLLYFQIIDEVDFSGNPFVEFMKSEKYIKD